MCGCVQCLDQISSPQSYGSTPSKDEMLEGSYEACPICQEDFTDPIKLRSLLCLYACTVYSPPLPFCSTYFVRIACFNGLTEKEHVRYAEPVDDPKWRDGCSMAAIFFDNSALLLLNLFPPFIMYSF